MGTETDIWYFENIDLFNIFCPHKVEKDFDNHQFKSFKKNDYVYFPDESSSHVYLIANGRVKIGSYGADGKETVRAILSKGEIFGEKSILGEATRKDYAQALDSNVSICPLNVNDMQELMANNSDLSINMTRLIGFKLLRAERRIESMVNKDARTRIIEFLCDWADDKGQKIGFETLVKGFFTHQDIASLTATSRQTVTTTLNELREENLLTFDRKRLLIRDLDKLKGEIL